MNSSWWSKLVTIAIASACLESTNAFAPSKNSVSQNHFLRNEKHSLHTPTTTQLNVLPCPFPSLLAGSIAGAAGVGIAFPLDTIKTKSQVLATAPKQQDLSTVIVDPQTGTMSFPPPSNNNDLLQVSQYIWDTEGLAGFFGGVQTSMAGQAIIKAVVFAVNAFMLDFCKCHHFFNDNTSLQMLAAAATAGFVTSFLAAPVDRIKVLMQADGSAYHGRENEAIDAVLQTEGWKGLLSRGLGCTMVREIPAYSMYFWVYGSLQGMTAVTQDLGPWAPLIYGAIAGCACWLPIYPVDVVKTVVQNTEGGSNKDGSKSMSELQVAIDLYQTHGVGVFYDGIAPRLLRQAVNHAATFALYELLLENVFLKI